MGDKTQGEAMLGDLGERRIEQERHVVVDRLDDRHLVHAVVVDGDIPERDPGLAARAGLGKRRQCRSRDGGAALRIEAGEIPGSVREKSVVSKPLARCTRCISGATICATGRSCLRFSKSAMTLSSKAGQDRHVPTVFRVPLRGVLSSLWAEPERRPCGPPETSF